MEENLNPNVSRPCCPRKRAGMISSVMFFWLNGLLRLGSKRTLKDEDLFPLPNEHEAHTLTTELEVQWAQEVRHAELTGRSPRLWRALLQTVTYYKLFLMLGLKFFELIGSAAMSILLWFYLKKLNEGVHMNQLSTLPLVVGISLATLLKLFCYHHHDYQTYLKGMQLRVSLIGLLYKKILMLSRNALSRINTGHIINLISNDAQRLEQGVMNLGMAMMAPLEFLVIAILLVVLVGWEALSGAGFLLVVMVYNYITSRFFAKLRVNAACVTDHRLSVMDDVISSIRHVKMHAWEWNYRDEVKALRRAEMKIIWKKSQIITSMIVTYLTSASVATLISVVTLLYSGVRLSAFDIFTLTTLLNIMKFSVTVQLSEVMDLFVAIDRMEAFLVEPSAHTRHIQGEGFPLKQPLYFRSFDVLSSKKKLMKTSSKLLPNILRISSLKLSKPNLTKLMKSNIKSHLMEVKPHLMLRNVSASWPLDQSIKQSLSEITLSLPCGQLLIVTGPVGAGKSTLLMSILGEVPITRGTIAGQGTLAYVSQTPWIFSGTVRDNIILGQDFDDKRYQNILQVCDLVGDLKRFPKNDLTMIGQRGVSLSGGQRVRVSLARALYSDADIYLLDDPLSAVDNRVGQHIFKECICGLISNKVRILVTHQIHYLTGCDNIVVLNNGYIIGKGSYDDLMTQGILDIVHREDFCQINNYENGHIHDLTGAGEQGGACAVEEDIGGQDLEEDKENQVTGTVTWRLYWQYFRVGLPVVPLVCMALFFLVVQVVLIASNWWLSRIANMSRTEQSSVTTMTIYAALVTSAILLASARILFFLYTILKSSEKLHNSMVVSILKSPLLFFDKNPVGRVLNRFSKDIGMMDDVLPMKFMYALNIAVSALGVAVLTAVYNVWLVIVAVALLVAVMWIARFYLRSARALKRMEATRCSPVYAHISDTLKGLETIHSLRREPQFFKLLEKYQDEHTKAFFLVISTGQWLSVLIDLLCTVLITAVGVGSLILVQDPAITGLVLTLAIETLSGAQYSVRVLTEVESLMTSVERVMAYTELPPEPGYSRRNLPPEAWPSSGSLAIQGLNFEYLEGGPRILFDIDLKVNPREKVGIVGRTGAGKSSMVAALFRMPEPRGRVLIDGIDLGDIDIQAARSSMAVISQDPALLVGTLRKNLDPFNFFLDEDIWVVLEDVQLLSTVQDLPGKLESHIGESGSGFSVGERQLLCLARALLQRCKLLVMDEATANIDHRTDQLVQHVIRDKFADCTVLTIAHRVDTIMDYDRVVVMDNGRVVELDKPRVLAEKENGVFRRLLMRSPERT